MDNSANSKKAWDQYFVEGWVEKEGNEQTIFFSFLALKNFPKWLVEDLKKGLTVVDVGCAMGESVDIFQKKFKESQVSGIDFSSEAIKTAKIKFPKYKFFCRSITNLGKKYDAVFSSNTLEHFYDPHQKLKKLTKFANKYLILLVPFQEYERTEGHFYTFDYQSFPLAIGDFSLAFSKIIPTWNIPNNRWPGTPSSPGKQILIIYAKNHHIKDKKINLNSLVPEDANSLAIDQSNNAQFLQSELDKIHNSNFWKIALTYYKIRDLLLSFLKPRK